MINCLRVEFTYALTNDQTSITVNAEDRRCSLIRSIDVKYTDLATDKYLVAFTKTNIPKGWSTNSGCLERSFLTQQLRRCSHRWRDKLGSAPWAKKRICDTSRREVFEVMWDE